MAEHPTIKHTKAEILKMYDDLLRENAQLEKQVQQLQQEKRESGKGAVGPAAAAKTPAGAPKAAPSTLDGVIATLTALRPGFGNAVSELSAKLLAEAATLAELRSAIAVEQTQLEALHDLSVTDGTLQQLIHEYSEKSAAFEQERTQKQNAFEREMSEKRTTWKKEQDEHARTIKERDEHAKKAEKREATEYTYNLEHRRKLDIDQYNQQQQQLQQALVDFETRHKKAWAEREQTIAEQEREFKELQSAVDKYPKELDAVIKKAEAEGTAIARRQTTVKADLRAKEAEGERRVYELQVQSLEDTLKQQQEQLKSLSAQLDATTKQAQTLALKAIEGASSAGSFQAVKEIALEQAKTSQKS